MSCIAIITARGGSKRIPRKNIKEFCGKPIIAYSIEAALNSNIFDEVMVSTDDQEIAEIAKKYGASVPFFRSEKTSNDYATTIDVLTEVLDEYKKRGMVFDTMCCLYPTAPFVTSDKLHDASKIFFEKDADQLIPVVSFSFPPLRGLKIENDCLKYVWPEHMLTRSQDLEPMYHDVGQFYFYKTSMVYERKAFADVKVVPFEISELEVQDIDNESDWKMAELKYKMIHNL